MLDAILLPIGEGTLEASESMEPLLAGTIAMLEVMAPSAAFKIEETGQGTPSCQRLK